jgi:hypothetical protein
LDLRLPQIGLPSAIAAVHSSQRAVDGVTQRPDELAAGSHRQEARRQASGVGAGVTPSATQTQMLEAACETLAAMGQALLLNGLDREALEVFVALRRLGWSPDDRLS